MHGCAAKTFSPIRSTSRSLRSHLRNAAPRARRGRRSVRSRSGSSSGRRRCIFPRSAGAGKSENAPLVDRCRNCRNRIDTGVRVRSGGIDSAHRFTCRASCPLGLVVGRSVRIRRLGFDAVRLANARRPADCGGVGAGASRYAAFRHSEKCRRDVVLSVNVAGPFGARSATREIAVASKPAAHPSAAAGSKLKIAAFAIAPGAVRAARR